MYIYIYKIKDLKKIKSLIKNLLIKIFFLKKLKFFFLKS